MIVARNGEGHRYRLVQALEQEVRLQRHYPVGRHDDEDDRTSLAGLICIQMLDALKQIRNLRRHPYEFYEKQVSSLLALCPVQWMRQTGHLYGGVCGSSGSKPDGWNGLLGVLRILSGSFWCSGYFPSS